MQVEKMKQTIVSKSPRTGQVLGKVAITQVEQAHQIIAKAKEAARTWGHRLSPNAAAFYGAPTITFTNISTKSPR
jgi:acyl-CoA reductase-like NAD-dependent aldehyde dehydrogenase